MILKLKGRDDAEDDDCDGRRAEDSSIACVKKFCRFSFSFFDSFFFLLAAAAAAVFVHLDCRLARMFGREKDEPFVDEDDEDDEDDDDAAIETEEEEEEAEEEEDGAIDAKEAEDAEEEGVEVEEEEEVGVEAEEEDAPTRSRLSAFATP